MYYNGNAPIPSATNAIEQIEGGGVVAGLLIMP